LGKGNVTIASTFLFTSLSGYVKSNAITEVITDLIARFGTLDKVIK